MTVRMKDGVPLETLDPERLANELVSFILKEGQSGRGMSTSRMSAFMVDCFRLMREQCAVVVEKQGAPKLAGLIRDLPNQQPKPGSSLILPKGFRVT